MKKRTKSNVRKDKAINPVEEAAAFAVEQDIAVLLSTLVGKLSSFESKLDAILSRVTAAQSAAPSAPVPPVPAPAPAPERRRERSHLYEAVCADCGQDCDIPFKPSPNRPVYCRSCFIKRKQEGTLKPKEESRPAAAEPQSIAVPKPSVTVKPAQLAQKKKVAIKKSPAGKKPAKNPAAKKAVKKKTALAPKKKTSRRK